MMRTTARTLSARVDHTQRHGRTARGWPAVGLLLTALVCACSGNHQAERPFPEIGGVGPEVYTLTQGGVVRIEAGMRVGTGFVVSDNGEVVTAAHVVRDALEIIVQLPNQARMPATLVALDEPGDLALLRVAPEAASGLQPLHLLAPEDALRPGHEVWTIAHPRGRSWNIARGVVVQPVEGDRLLTSLDADAGSSGAPVLAYIEPGRVEVAGLVSRVLGGGPGTPAVAIAASALVRGIEQLRTGKSTGWSDPVAFVASLPGRSPLVHQMTLARHVLIEGVDQIDMPYDMLAVAGFPALETLELRTTWRYFFAGHHTFQFRVVRLLEDGSKELVHEGPLRVFDLEDERASYVYKVEIDVRLPSVGDYLVQVFTDGGVSAVAPLTVLGDDALAPNYPLAWPFAHRPAQHTMLVASHVDNPAAGRAASVPPPDPEPASVDDARATLEPMQGDEDSGDEFGGAVNEPLRDAEDEPRVPLSETTDGEGEAPDVATPNAGQPDGAVLLTTRASEGVRIRGTFNTVHLEQFPSIVKFDTWTRWSFAFAGEHTFRHVLVDAVGAMVAQSATASFSLADDRSSYQHVGQWDVELPTAGVYFLLCITDDVITRVLPIWVQER